MRATTCATPWWQARRVRCAFASRATCTTCRSTDPRQGEFRIAARVKDVTYAFVPRRLQAAGELPWPALTQLGGELVFERSSMRVNGASGAFSGTRQTQLSKVQAHIPDLSHTVVSVGADARGPLAELLGVLSGSPLGAMTGHALDQARGSGNAQLRLDLSLPIDALHTAKVRGSVALAGNDVRITPDTPLLARARGAVQFTETGFALQGVQARALGGDVRLEGGMRALPANAPASESALQLRAQGVATAEGLQQAGELGFVAQLARKASGSTPYTVALAVRRGVPELQVATTLQGLALALPAPLAKSADSALPVRFETQLTREALASAAPGAKAAPLHDVLTLDLGRLGSVQYVRDLAGPEPQVLRGAIAVGLRPGETAPLPPRGVVANIQLETVDVDAWEAVLLPQASAAAPAPVAPNAPAAPDYLPTVLALRARELAYQGRSLHEVTAGGSREGAVWRANLDATELDGYLEYRQAGTPDSPAGRLFARLSRLTVPPSAASQVDALLEEPPGSLPALDIVVDDFELHGRKWGRLEIAALNRGGAGAQREWRLSKFNIDAPEATLTASGSWAVRNAALPAPSAARAPQRHTLLDFQLDIRDSGELLRRFGMADVVRRGKGRLQGQVAWQGAPAQPGLPLDDRPGPPGRGSGPVPQGRSGPGQAARRAEPAIAAAPPDARLPRRLQRRLCLRLRARRCAHRPRRGHHQQPADEGRQRGRADGGACRHRARDAGPARRGGARDQCHDGVARGHGHQPGDRAGQFPGAGVPARPADRGGDPGVPHRRHLGRPARAAPATARPLRQCGRRGAT